MLLTKLKLMLVPLFKAFKAVLAAWELVEWFRGVM